MKKFNFLIALSLTFVLSLLSSCVDKPEEEVVQPFGPPEIPPAEVFNIPSTAWGMSGTDTTDLPGSTYYHWLHAGVNLAFWNGVILVNTAVPVAAFGAALNETPVLLEDGSWEWTYEIDDFNDLTGKTYEARLNGKFINAFREVEWTMTLSEIGGFTEFVWYKGVVATDFSEANFVIYQKPENPEPLFSTDYKREGEDHSLRFTNISPSTEDIGAYIEYRVDADNPYNRAFDVNGVPNNPDLFLEIQWMEPSKEGRVKHIERFGDDDWRCWDELKRDITCP